MSENKTPVLRLATDDDMSSTSCLQISVCKSLHVIEIEHMNQSGRIETIYLYPCQVDDLTKFLQKSKAWIESGYDPELKPESYAENTTDWFDKMWK